MTIRLFPGPEPLRGDAQPCPDRARSEVREAAHRARRVLPGALGELASRELTAYADFGFGFAADSLIPRLAAEILATPAPRDQ